MHFFYCPGNNEAQQNCFKRDGEIYTVFWFVLGKAASMNHHISITSPNYHYLAFLSITYYSLTSWVHHKDQYSFPESGWEFFHHPVERGAASFMTALSKTVFLKQGTRTDEDECESWVQIAAHGSWSHWVGCQIFWSRHQPAFPDIIPHISAVAFLNTKAWIELFISVSHSHCILPLLKQQLHRLQAVNSTCNMVIYRVQLWTSHKQVFLHNHYHTAMDSAQCFSAQAGGRGGLREGETRGCHRTMRWVWGAGLAVNPRDSSQALTCTGDAPQRGLRRTCWQDWGEKASLGNHVALICIDNKCWASFRHIPLIQALF